MGDLELWIWRLRGWLHRLLHRRQTLSPVGDNG